MNHRKAILTEVDRYSYCATHLYRHHWHVNLMCILYKRMSIHAINPLFEGDKKTKGYHLDSTVVQRCRTKSIEELMFGLKKWPFFRGQDLLLWFLVCWLEEIVDCWLPLFVLRYFTHLGCWHMVKFHVDISGVSY